jgi:hypothetical protein
MGIRLVFASFILAVACVAQSYDGMQARSIKSLSEQQVADLSAGRGMGLALPPNLMVIPAVSCSGVGRQTRFVRQPA